MPDTWTLLRRRRQGSATLPVVTYLDPDGSRTELSAISLENAAAKIANALRTDLDLEPGAAIGLHLPLHWQRAAWCAGAWTAGCLVVPNALDADLVVASAERAAALGGLGHDVAVVSLHPFGLPIVTPLPAFAFDATVTVRQQPDAYLFEPPGPHLPALRIGTRELSQEQALAEAGERGRRWGLATGGRLLVTGGSGRDTDGASTDDELDLWLAVLAVPLARDGSVVIAPGADPLGPRVLQERPTATAS